MPNFSLPSVGSNADIKALANAFMMLVKELKFILQNLDSDNVSRLDADKTVFENLQAQTIVTEVLLSDLILSNTTITDVLYAKEGRIARLTVDHLLTGDFLSGSEHIYFMDMQQQYLRFVEGTRRDDLDQVHYTDEAGAPLYWNSESHEYITPEVTEHPVMVYVYDLLIKLQIDFEDENGTMIPKIIYGAGVGNLDHPEWGKGYDYKETEGLLRKYISSTGEEKTVYLNNDNIEIKNGAGAVITMGDFVDAKMRRASSIDINKGLGQVTVLMEGESVPDTIDYTETADSITYTWPDGHTATVSIS